VAAVLVTLMAFEIRQEVVDVHTPTRHRLPKLMHYGYWAFLVLTVDFTLQVDS